MRPTHKIPELIDPHALNTTNGQEAWRVLGIMAEFAIATERLRGLRPAVSMFGSARIKAGHPYYEKAKAIARLLSDAGFSVISGGGPGLMHAFNEGAHGGTSPAVGLNILLPFEERRQSVPGRVGRLPLFLHAQDDVRALRVGVRHPARRLRHARRAGRSADARADRQEPAHSGDPRRRRVLARPSCVDGGQARRRRHDRGRRHGASCR